MADLPWPTPEQGENGFSSRRTDAEISDAVQAAHRDPAGLARAFASAPTTLLHADLWPVNLAIDAAGVTFLDWAIATARPAALECTIVLSGAADHAEASREQIIATFRRASGDLTDDRTTRIALFASLCDLRWNNALDAAGNPDPAQRGGGAADLAWWVGAGRTALADLNTLTI